MPDPEDRQILEFEDFELDPRGRSLKRGGRSVAITAKVFDALVVLAGNHGRVVEKDEMLQKIWPDTVVEEGNLHHCISTLRRTLGEKADERRYIATVPGRGYSFIPVVRVRTSVPQPAKASWQRRPAAAVIGGIATLLLAAAAAWLWFGGAQRQRSLARAIPLTAVPGFAESPTFSPDGRQIAYSWRPENDENSHIYAKLIGSESTRQLTSGPYADSAPAWSPDGKLIAFFRRPRPGDRLWICVIAAAGGEPRILYTREFEKLDGIQVSWTRDSRQILFVHRTSVDAPPGLYSLTVETGQVRPIAGSLDGQLHLSPAVSPDGGLLAFLLARERGFSILVLPSQGGDPRLILDPGQEVDRTPLAWEPDSRHLVYRSTQGGLWEVAVSDGRRQRLPIGGDSASFPAVSPHGDLAFIESSQQMALQQIDWPVGGAPAVTRTVLESTRRMLDPQWSPDARQIAFYSDRSGSTEIWKCDADGTNLQQLTSFAGPLTRNPRWSPDGKSIAFDSAPGGHGHLYVVDSGGGPARRVTSSDFDEIIPAWSDDGTRIYFTSEKTGTAQIWSVPASGGEATQITFLGGFFPAISADHYLYYVRTAPGGRTLLRMPERGGAEEVVLDSALGFRTWWALVPGGLFYIDRNDALRYFDMATRRSTDPLRQFRPGQVPTASAIAASRDGRSVLCPVVTRSVSDVMLAIRFW